MQSQLPKGSFIPKGIQDGVLPLNKMLSPQSQFSVIDTAIVLSTTDTARHLYSFNSNAKKTSDLTQKLTGGLWMDTQRETNTYDANNNMLTELHEYWSNGQWVNTWRYTYTYDANNNVLTYLYEQWSNGQLLEPLRGTYTYDANNNMLTHLVKEWEQYVLGQLVYSKLYTYTYDANNNMLTELLESWWNGQWVNTWRYTYTYDANNNILTYLLEQWSNGQWEYWYRYTYTYDANNNVLTYLDEQWWNGQWVNQGRYTYTYDAQGGLTSASFYGWINSSWSPMDYHHIFGYWVSDDAGNFYSFDRGYNFTFIRKVIVTGVASDIGNIAAAYSLSQNYPNPFNPSTKISWQLTVGSQATLKVYDILGREVATLVNDYRQAGKYETEFNAETLPSGVYFYRLQAGLFVEAKKMILLK